MNIVLKPRSQVTLRATAVRWHKGAWLVAFDGIDDAGPRTAGLPYLPAQGGPAAATYYYEASWKMRCVDSRTVAGH
jgi:hypothetical protein